jgi:C4-dicarboxylate transporter, DctQ subunit
MFSARGLQRVLAGASRIEQWLCFIAFMVMAGALFLDVLLRELLGNGLPWARQVGVYGNIVVALLGIGLASAQGSHLRPRFADAWLPARIEPLVLTLQHLVTALFFTGFALIALQLVAESHALGEISTVLRIPVWPVQALLPLAFTLAALRHLAYALVSELRPVTELAQE